MFKLARIAQALLAGSLVLGGSTAAFAAAKEKGAHEHLVFPMKADAFNQIVEKRVTTIEARVDKRLAKSNLTDEKKAAVKKEVATGVAEIREAAKKAEADGTVTKDEAKDVRAAERKLQGQLKAELPHTKHAKK